MTFTEASDSSQKNLLRNHAEDTILGANAPRSMNFSLGDSEKEDDTDVIHIVQYLASINQAKHNSTEWTNPFAAEDGENLSDQEDSFSQEDDSFNLPKLPYLWKSPHHEIIAAGEESWEMEYPQLAKLQEYMYSSSTISEYMPPVDTTMGPIAYPLASSNESGKQIALGGLDRPAVTDPWSGFPKNNMSITCSGMCNLYYFNKRIHVAQEAPFRHDPKSLLKSQQDYITHLEAETRQLKLELEMVKSLKEEAQQLKQN
ncbi:hypothetical protein ZIOFF_050291 [Zingiber officinale]|uniref:Uncharacterized protein n=1 Tax=Zingiber officinale TaxID=94328 RepID=A0A8J5KTJ7_ZINOF|nr:hypothetical protein ZIOFF_050291 [Zingiber officinale]